MPKKQPHVPKGWEDYKGPYSAALTIGNMVVVSGQGPLDPDGPKIVGSTIQEQAKVTLDNVKGALEAAGATMDDCVKIGVFLDDINDFDAFNEVYRTYFTDPLPCRTALECNLWGGILIEIDAWAVKDTAG